MQQQPKHYIESSDPVERDIGACWAIPTKKERRKCILDTTETHWDRIPYFDTFSVFHFLYGAILGALITWIALQITFTPLIVIFACLVIPTSIVASYLPAGSLLQNLFGGINDNITVHLRHEIFEPLESWFNQTEYIDIATKLNDLMNEFYSGFLDKYDHETRKNMGVVCTDEAIVDFMVRGVDHLLTKIFHEDKGIASTNIKYLDPSSGTMAYPCKLMELVYKKISKDVDRDASTLGSETEKRAVFNTWFRNAFLRKEKGFGTIFGFEILMAPYILGSLRTLMTAETLGATVNYRDDKVQQYLLNTLMDIPRDRPVEELLNKLQNKKMKSELEEGLKIREREEIMVLMSNPPYNVSSQNSSQWITDLVNQYIDPKILNAKDEKDVSSLAAMKDDYVKFIRFAQWKLADKNKKGIIAYITNRKYISNVAARGMRYMLQRDFDEIWIIDLHGDHREALSSDIKKQGIKDENVFGIDCGVAIAFFIRYEKHQPFNCKIHYTEIWGTKNERLHALSSNTISTLKFIDIPQHPNYEFVPFKTDPTIRQNYQKQYVNIYTIFKKSSACIDTGHSSDVVDYDIAALMPKIEVNFRTYMGEKNTQENKEKTWNPYRIHNADIERTKRCLMHVIWCGFDYRYIIYDHHLLARSRYEVMQYMTDMQHNIAIIANRGNRSKSNSCYFITNMVAEGSCLNRKDRAYIFPLMVNIAKEDDDYYAPRLPNSPNIDPKFMQQLPYWDWEKLSMDEKRTVSESVFYYIYGILFAVTYRKDYGELLIKEYPRIPFPIEQSTFDTMSAHGKQLASYHLMTNPSTCDVRRYRTTIDAIETRADIRIQKYGWLPHTDDATIGDIWFDTQTKAIKHPDGTKTKITFGNPSALCILNVSKAVWEFEIGGIVQLDQWLYARRFAIDPQKDHLTRGITMDELKYFLKVLNAITDTLVLLPSIDIVYKTIAENLFDAWKTDTPEPVEVTSETMSAPKKKKKPTD